MGVKLPRHNAIALFNLEVLSAFEPDKMMSLSALKAASRKLGVPVPEGLLCQATSWETAPISKLEQLNILMLCLMVQDSATTCIEENKMQFEHSPHSSCQ